MEKQLEHELNILIELRLYPFLKLMGEGTSIPKRSLQKERVKEVQKFIKDLPPKYEQYQKEALDITIKKLTTMNLSLETNNKKPKIKKENQKER